MAGVTKKRHSLVPAPFSESGAVNVLNAVRESLKEKFPEKADRAAFLRTVILESVGESRSLFSENDLNTLIEHLVNSESVSLPESSDVIYILSHALEHTSLPEKLQLDKEKLLQELHISGGVSSEDAQNQAPEGAAASSGDVVEPKIGEEHRRRGRPVSARPHMGSEHLLVDRRRKPKRSKRRRQSVELGPLRKKLKPLDETENTFRQRVRDPSRFSVLRTITITDGIRAVVGRPKGQTTTKIQSLIFSKKKFPTPESVHEWIRDHPQIVKSYRTAWEQVAKTAIPMSGECFPFIIHATFDGLSEKDKDKPFALLAKDYKYRVDFRFGSDRINGFFGFRSDNVCVKSALDLSDIEVKPRDIGPKFWLTKEDELAANGFFPPTRTWTKRFVLDRGEYRLNFATPECFSVHLSGDAIKGEAEFRFVPGIGWVFLSGLPRASVGTVKSWVDRGYSWVVVPEGTSHTMVNVAKELGRKLDAYTIVKSSDERRYTLGIAFPAHRVDSDRDWASPETVEKAAWTFLSRANVGLFHKNGTEGAGIPVESYIYRGPDWTVERKDEDGNVIARETVRAGDWLLGVIWNEEAWQLVKSGQITGYSLEGTAKRRIRELSDALSSDIGQ